MKKIYYQYVYLFYDIGEKRVSKVFNICKKYLNHYQKSVFKGELTTSDIISLENELKKVIKEDDSITILKLKHKEDLEEYKDTFIKNGIKAFF